jgi:sporulation protein YlmC with PRC-barrel domain
VEDLGAQVAYVVLQAGIPVYDRDGHAVGVVEHVITDEGEDVFHGLIVRSTPAPGRQLFADSGQIRDLHQRGVVLGVTGAELHDPGENPEARQTAGSSRQESLRRAYEWVRHPG